MRIHEVNIFIIKMPLKQPFTTALETVNEREGIILEVIDEQGEKGYGEVVAFSTPWYTEETVKTCYHMLKDLLIPLVLDKQINHPNDLQMIFNHIRGNHMAKAGLETAIWDLYSKLVSKPLWTVVNGVRDEVLAGVVVGTANINDAIEQIHVYLEDGYERVKVKIKPGKDYQLIKEIRTYFPDLALMADANSSYTLNDIDVLKSLDKFNLLMIEQPLAVDDIVEHSILQKELKTPICLDESIITYHDAESAIRLNSCGVINIKIGRVGGLHNAIAIHDLCQKNNIQVWCGGMIEFGVSRAHNIALSTKEGFTIPGDLSASNRFWEEDIIYPQVEVANGKVKVPNQPGIGFDINFNRLHQVTTYHENINCKH
ncbi:o-succinylbenzoate synthase [Heyndrickxia sporothermodurans]|uniref:o-succinylbenzoate synthase n=1 Tax=Heyndrickxia sporothermodurans TaxID=46224 RepID=UPI002DBC77DD|nr:o-succinylbenzoate synthase [Heyndrickxia sporothermodurans]MEB6551265.1 o-succinylbenzoate synthase [Heyndrickxia sporothermodurans]MED3649456.1 o-succinylbenzoate synthase [Heyndrickxia sporothermodurans]MED3652820.1 o-succinylbenzoate synthase [Heyndrickxia sporothermodurans]MED3696422.1 o-succinylbenzoate synthase [Heyndrickxia sporothermodurans]MED3779478.1 o-succinylbenzoate synthase [Heyndrickxia sporothermodurans]